MTVAANTSFKSRDVIPFVEGDGTGPDIWAASQKVLDAAALKHQAQPATAPVAEDLKPPPRPIEGEMGVAIGTGGYREAFGTAVVPLGQDGVAIVSFDTVESNRGRSHRRR